MSTSATIVVKVRKEDLCKIKTAQSDFVKMYFRDFNSLIKEYGKERATDFFNRGADRLPDINKFQCRVKHVKLSPYLEIYSHFDGYVDGVGRCLIENFGTYEKALNLVLCGDHSSIINGARYTENYTENYQETVIFKRNIGSLIIKNRVLTEK